MNRLERENVLRLFEQLHQNDNAYFYRSSGNNYCKHCGIHYRNHPYDVENTYCEHYEGDHRLCNGDIVHL